jgi:hypothetical protein
VGVRDDLQTLVCELDRIHGNGFHDAKAVITESGLPDFVTAENGVQRHFTGKARQALAHVAATLHGDDSSISSFIELGNFENILRQTLADLHAAGDFEGFCANGNVDAKAKLLKEIHSRISRLTNEFTHSFGAWTLGMEWKHPFRLGPVTFFSREQWIDSVDFHEEAKEHYLEEKEANFRWREILKEALSRPKDATPLPGLASAVYSALAECPSVLKVTIKGHEKELSRKLAELVCKTALDAVSLLFGGPEFFHQQALHDERLPPVGSDRLTESNGFLWLPGMSLGLRIRHLSYDQVTTALTNMSRSLEKFEPILDALVNPASHSHPKLAQRWATALDWFGEGNREKSDAIALAKIGTSLDVLCCGGKFKGIRDTVVHLTGVPGDEEVIRGRQSKTLSALVKNIYDDGRSQILHGTHYERLKSFAQERDRAAYIARIVLIEAAVRLSKYTGDDTDKAFRTMPK